MHEAKTSAHCQEMACILPYFTQPPHHSLSQLKRMNGAGGNAKQVVCKLIADIWIRSEIRERHVGAILQSHLGIWIHSQLKGLVLCTECLNICSIKLSAPWTWYVRGNLINALTSFPNLFAAPVDNYEETILWSLIEVINSFYNIRFL